MADETRHYRNFRGGTTAGSTREPGQQVFRNPTNHLRARGSMTYLEFIRLVRRLWEDAHPEIPIVPNQGSQQSAIRDVCIVYGIETRQTHTSDPKIRKRETIEHNGEMYVVMGQRFTNVISFAVLTRTVSDGGPDLNGPELAEEVIEVFESFMMEYTPIFKEMGVSELVYGRRLPDSEQNRRGPDINVRTVTYLVTLEKVFATSEERLEQISVDARVFLDRLRSETRDLNDQMKMNLGGEWNEYSNQPRYTVGPGEYPEYVIQDGRLSAPETAFRIGDLVMINAESGDLESGYYVVYSRDGELYDLAEPVWDRGEDGFLNLTGETPAITLTSGSGEIWHIPDTYVRSKISDEGSESPE